MMSMNTDAKEFFKGKKALVVVLGAYGGGAATAKWLLKHGAKVTVTDFRTKDELQLAFGMFTPAEKKRIRFVLGGQREEDFRKCDIVVAGPGVPRESMYLKAARKARVPIENEASLFFRFNVRPVIAVTGTRGKTTVAHWIAHLLSKKYPHTKVSGNSQTGERNTSNPLLAEIDRTDDGETPVIAELSSWQLEMLPNAKKAPHIAVITNVFPDHLDRYDGMEDYVRAKANIFKYQAKDDHLILNKKNPWTKYILAQKPKSKVSFFSGGEALAENRAAARLAAELFDPKIRITKRTLQNLPSIPYRQEVIWEENGLQIVNDSAATSPDAVAFAIKRFCRNKSASVQSTLITGGTDKKLEFRDLAKEINKTLVAERVIFLGGSATEKLLRELDKVEFFKKFRPKIFQNLEECLTAALDALPRKKGVILFSPGAASFEKFKNEFDRGEQFAKLAKKMLA